MISAQREESLLQRAKGGDETAFWLLVEAASQRIRHRLDRRIPDQLRSVVDVDDVLADAASIGWRYLPSFVPLVPNAFTCFLARRAFLRLRDLIRTHRNRAGLFVSSSKPHRVDDNQDTFGDLVNYLAGPGKTPSGLAAISEARDRVRSAFGVLPGLTQKVVWARVVDKFSIRETATVYSISEKKTRIIFDKAMAELRRTLGDQSKYWSSKS